MCMPSRDPYARPKAQPTVEQHPLALGQPQVVSTVVLGYTQNDHFLPSSRPQLSTTQ